MHFGTSLDFLYCTLGSILKKIRAHAQAWAHKAKNVCARIFFKIYHKVDIMLIYFYATNQHPRAKNQKWESSL